MFDTILKEPELVESSIEMSRAEKPRRSKLQSECEVLKAIGSGEEKPTRIMYKANLSWKVLRVYLAHLQRIGLVTEVESEERKIYRLSSKGFEVLHNYLSLVERFSF